MSEKIPLSEVLAGVDRNCKELWDALDAEQRKRDINLFTLNRYISYVQGSREKQEHHVVVCNEIYNKNLFAIMSKHPQLAWYTACACSYDEDETQSHKWLGLKKAKNKKVEFLANLFPDKKMSDIETLSEITTTKEIKEYCENLGWDKKQITGIKF